MKVRDIAPYGVRMPSDLKEKIQEQAKAHGRSMNAEIVQILEESFDDFSEDEERNDEDLIKLYEQQIEAMKSVIDMQEKSFNLATEQIALLKLHYKMATGVDIQDFLNKTVNYKEIAERYGLKNEDKEP
ncbi:Arc family DNA-binding protein (plasmid) [Enterobacter asburiae]|uniref:Arc family DNA-binding protein n=1 Tax=Enterobacter asburiae TaxID=61645 RepID=UPI0032AEF0BD